jgi:DNA-binding transcriptional MerR regulator/LysM repeat protein
MRFAKSLLMLLLAGLLLAALTPAAAEWTRQDTCTPAQPAGWVVYAVQPGDTLSDIAARSGSTVAELQRANCIENPRLLRVQHRLYAPEDPGPPAGPFARRCLNAGYSAEECRRIFNAMSDSDVPGLAERCRAAGLTTEQCRRAYNAFNGDDILGLAERCRAAGLTAEECRRAYNAYHGGDVPGLAERCRATGLTTEECRRLAHSESDTNTPPVDPIRDQQRDQQRDQTGDQVGDQDQTRDRDQTNDSAPNPGRNRSEGGR